MTERELITRWVRAWQQAGPELERIRQRELRDQDNRETIQLLARAFNFATRSQPPRESSGLIEMQRYFAKLPKQP